jgi:hypothetical protein
MKPRPAWIILFSGAALVAATLAWASASGVGIPFPDAPPEQQARAARVSRAVDYSILGGFILIGAGAIGLLLRPSRKTRPGSAPDA